MNVTPKRIALNVEVIGDVRNAMVVVTWIAMCAMAMDSAGIVEVMVVFVVLNVEVLADVESVAVQVRLCVEIVMGLEKREILRLICMGVSSGLHAWHAMEQDTLHANTVLQQV